MREKRVAFDIGNVLVRVDVNDFISALYNEGVFKSLEIASEFVNGIQAGQDLGLFNIKQSIIHVKPDIGDNKLRYLTNHWKGLIEPSYIILDFVEDLLESGWSVALLSNIGIDHAAEIRKKCPVFSRCIQHFSCEVGARKPTKLYFQSFWHQYAWIGPYFFDDRKDNVEASSRYLKGVQFDLDKFDSDKDAVDFIKGKLFSDI